MDRSTTYELLTEHTKNNNLIKHALAVEAAMKAYARKSGEDELLWGCTGLIHDFDYEQHPDMSEHGLKGAEILETEGFPAKVIHAVKAHAGHVPIESPLDKTLFAVDELTGFIVAVALVRPSKSVMDVKVKSVKKKMKTKEFAKAVSREDIRKGADLLEIPLEEHIQNVIEAMQSIAGELGLGMNANGEKP